MREINEQRLAVYMDILGYWRMAVHAKETEKAERLLITAEVMEDVFPGMKELRDARYPPYVTDSARNARERPRGDL